MTILEHAVHDGAVPIRLQAVVRSIGEHIRRANEARTRRRQNRIDERILQSMSDAQLRDIGLTRRGLAPGPSDWHGYLLQNAGRR